MSEANTSTVTADAPREKLNKKAMMAGTGGSRSPLRDVKNSPKAHHPFVTIQRFNDLTI
jgi:hypothetical protein